MGFGQDGAGEPEQGGGVGKTPTTSVRRLISLFSRSSGLVDQIFFQWLTGKAAKAVTSPAASRSIVSTLGNCQPSIAAIVSSWSWTWPGLGWAKMVRIAAATISADPLGTCARTLRRKCVAETVLPGNDKE